MKGPVLATRSRPRTLRPASRRLVGALGVILSSGACSPEAGSSEPMPFRDAWRTAFEVPFPYLDGEGSAQITMLTVGGAGSDGNFANRGDVIVLFDDAMAPETATIRVEARRFTTASSQALAEADFASLAVVAATGSPSRAPDDASRCDREAWRDACTVWVAYAGQSQPERAGADLRVTLPGFYRHALRVVTGDNDADTDYPNRGDVCVEGLHASLEVELGSGRALVTLDEAITPMPICELTPSLVENCEEHPDGAWAPACGCVAALGRFGEVEVATRDAAAAEVTVDLPAGLWAAIDLVNEATGQVAGGDPACGDGSPAGERCDACVELTDYTLDETLGTEATRQPWRTRGVANQPSDVASGGYSVRLSSDRCAPVADISGPEEYEPDLDALSVEERGNLRVCSGCLRGQSCATWLGD